MDDDDDVLNFSLASIVNGKSLTTQSKPASKISNQGSSSSSLAQQKKPITTECLIDLTEDTIVSQPPSLSSNSQTDKSQDVMHKSLEHPITKPTNKRKKKTPEEREQEELEKAQRKAQKDLEKEAERQKKLQEKEEAKKKKVEERRQNKKKTMEDCLMEIFIKLDSKLLSSKGGGDILAALQGKDLNVDFAQLPVPHSVEWLRKKDTSLSNSQNSQNLDENSNSMDSALLEEISSGQIVEHKNVLCEIVNQVLVRISGETLLEMLHNNTAQEFVKSVLNTHPKKSIIFLLEGVGEALKKDNREQTKAFKTGNNVRSPLSKQDIDKFVVWLQVEALCNARQTITLGETIDYIFRLSMAIATAPYRQDNSFSGFCAESVSRSSRTDDVWINQLMQISGVSYPVAKAISKQYPTFSSLMLMYESEGLTKKNKEELLASITREDTVNGAGRKLGVSISTKIYRVFNEVDGTKLVQDL